jgi:hypothetical protein
MNAIKATGLVLILAGALGLFADRFSFTKETQAAKLGPLELTVKERQTIDVPIWLGIGAIVIGGGLLLLGSRRH